MKFSMPFDAPFVDSGLPFDRLTASVVTAGQGPELVEGLRT
jgi:hypothetical protein